MGALEGLLQNFSDYMVCQVECFPLFCATVITIRWFLMSSDLTIFSKADLQLLFSISPWGEVQTQVTLGCTQNPQFSPTIEICLQSSGICVTHCPFESSSGRCLSCCFIEDAQNGCLARNGSSIDLNWGIYSNVNQYLRVTDTEAWPLGLGLNIFREYFRELFQISSVFL